MAPRRRWLLSLVALGASAWASPASGNGGGYAYGVKFTGSVAPFQASGTERVRIEEESLDIALRSADAAVTVRYTMRNVSGQPARVRFGFPVEAVLENDFEEEGPARPKGLAGAIQQLKGYTVVADGQPVPARFEIEPFATGKIAPFPGSRALQGIAGWMVSEVTFPVDAPVSLEIRYAADHVGKCESVSLDEHCEALTFAYRLSTGAVWNGPIGKGTVTIRADGIPADEVEIARPRGRFRRDGERWTWSFQDLEPTLDDDLRIHPVPARFTQGDYEERPWPDDKGDRGYLKWGGRWGAGHQRFRATASSTLKATKEHGFGAEHLAERWPKAPWAEGVPGPGLGEWVELEIPKPRPLLALAITSGFQLHYEPSRPELFEKNGRPSRVEVLLNGEHRFVATLGDRRGDQLVPIAGYAKPVSRVRITILDVFPGTRFEDTCITRIVLYDRLSREPEIHHAR